jgi:DNA-binding NtrC family response regulator
VIPLHLPPLRERREDVPLLAEHFLAKFAGTMGKPVSRVAPEASALLEAYAWPGNVRELENVMERAVVLGSGHRIGPDLIPDHVRTSPHFHIPRFVVPPEGISFKDVITDVEKRLIESTLDAAGGVQKKAAELLRIKPTTLNEMIKRYDIGRRRRKPDEDARSTRTRAISGSEFTHEP